MRTTLELDNDLLEAARRIAKQKGKSLGSVISELAYKSLDADEKPLYRNGARQLRHKPGAPMADMELVNRLRDEE